MTAVETPPPGSPTKVLILCFLLAIVLAGAAAAAFIAAAISMRSHHAGTWAVLGATIVFTLVVITIALGSARLAQRLNRQVCATPSAPVQRYTRRFVVAMILYVVALVTTISAFDSLRPPGALAYGLAITPALPLIAIIVIMGLYLREETDEFQRALLVESLLLATGGMLAIATIWGFLETFGLVPHVPGWAASPLWAMLFGPSQLIARWRYR